MKTSDVVEFFDMLLKDGFYYSDNLVIGAGMTVEYVIEFMIKEYNAKLRSGFESRINNRLSNLYWDNRADELRAVEWFEALRANVRLINPNYIEDEYESLAKRYSKKVIKDDNS